MAKQSLDLTGTSGTEYDLDKISEETRDNSEKVLKVQVYKYNPQSIDPNRREPNPLELEIGQIWLSKKDSDIV